VVFIVLNSYFHDKTFMPELLKDTSGEDGLA